MTLLIPVTPSVGSTCIMFSSPLSISSTSAIALHRCELGVGNARVGRYSSSGLSIITGASPRGIHIVVIIELGPLLADALSHSLAAFGMSIDVLLAALVICSNDGIGLITIPSIHERHECVGIVGHPSVGWCAVRIVSARSVTETSPCAGRW